MCDEDINVHDNTQVLWAISTRAKPAEDMLVVPVPTAALDPTVPEGQVGSALGIDATRPVGQPFPDVPVHPGIDLVPDLRAMVNEGA